MDSNHKKQRGSGVLFRIIKYFFQFHLIDTHRPHEAAVDQSLQRLLAKHPEFMCGRWCRIGQIP